MRGVRTNAGGLSTARAESVRVTHRTIEQNNTKTNCYRGYSGTPDSTSPLYYSILLDDHQVNRPLNN